MKRFVALLVLSGFMYMSGRIFASTNLDQFIYLPLVSNVDQANQENPTPTAVSGTVPTRTQTPTPTHTTLPLPMPTETNEPTPTPLPAKVEIIKIVYDPEIGKDLDGEYVEIHNSGHLPIDLTNYKLEDEKGFYGKRFPNYFVLLGGESVKVWVKEGDDDSENIYWDNTWSVWNNDGDTATLTDSNGVFIDDCSYGDLEGGRIADC